MLYDKVISGGPRGRVTMSEYKHDGCRFSYYEVN